MLASVASLALLAGLLDGVPVAAYFTTTWTGLDQPVVLDQDTTVTYSANNLSGHSNLVLCQTSATGALDESNTWTIFSIVTPCDHAPGVTECSLNPSLPATLAINLSAIGPFFSVQGVQTPAGAPSTLALPTADLRITNNQALLKDTLDSGAPTSTSSQSAAASTSLSSSTPSSVSSTSSSAPSKIVTTGTAYVVATETVTPTPTTTAVPGSSSKSGLPLGAKVGIPIAAATFACIALFFAMACLRRRRSKKHSKAMLSSDMHELGSRDLLAEKEAFTNSSLDEPHPSQARLYDSPAPTYSSAAEHRISRPPQLNPLSLTPQFEMSRNPSSASAAISARTTNSRTSRGLERVSDDGSEEPYSDVPIYGDARHSPQVFPAGGSTFLSEPGMSQEELARLEDEERRIDEAIAAAERARR
ncbi:hypothetical protein B7494_g1166 [Chlorociboria aeruginascens]|nr:hypothetical protein B7494_g1166 [Chlorociboria aeruginascens]